MEPPPPPPPPVPGDRYESLPHILFPARVARVQWAQALPGAALAGAFSLLLSIVILAIVPSAIFGIAFLAGGALAALLYRRQLKDRLPTPGEGGRVGAASGAFGFLYFAIMFLATLVYRPEELQTGMLESMSQLAARGYDPQKIQQLQEFLKTTQGFATFVIFCLLIMGLMFVTGSSIGGALYAAWLRKRRM